MSLARTMINKSILVSFLALISSLASNGFTTDLIHRDSTHSPTYDPSLTPSQRIANALKRSSSPRAQRLINMKLSKPEHEHEPEAVVTSVSGAYIMKVSVGTPPIPTIGIVDTGSDVVWTQCKPSIESFKQSLPFFSPRNSSSYRSIPCNSPICPSSFETQCSGHRQNCLYSALYGDGSYSRGVFATETFTFNGGENPVIIPRVLFGCGFKNGGLFSGVESGIVGLGGGSASLVTQLGPLAHGKFSYCLVPWMDNYNSSKLHFGDEARVSGEGVLTTPIFVREGEETFYFLSLEGISVGNLPRLEFYDDSSSPSKAKEQGNMIIDSGTTITLLPSIMYMKLKKALISLIKVKQTKDPNGMLDLCYASRGDISEFPKITMHFKGADLHWKFENAFLRLDEKIVCLAAAEVEDIGIYGNMAQINFLVGYDVVKRTVSFKPNVECAKY